MAGVNQTQASGSSLPLRVPGCSVMSPQREGGVPAGERQHFLCKFKKINDKRKGINHDEAPQTRHFSHVTSRGKSNDCKILTTIQETLKKINKKQSREGNIATRSESHVLVNIKMC